MPFFQGPLVVVVVMIDSIEKCNCLLGFDSRVRVIERRSKFVNSYSGLQHKIVNVSATAVIFIARSCLAVFADGKL